MCKGSESKSSVGFGVHFLRVDKYLCSFGGLF